MGNFGHLLIVIAVLALAALAVGIRRKWRSSDFTLSRKDNVIDLQTREARKAMK